MHADELFKQGQLFDAITAQIQEVKSHPGDHARRLFLFELLTFAGDLDRAGRQIQAIHYGELELDSAVAGYQRLLDAERSRRKLFQEGVAPQFLLDPPPHVAKHLEAIAALRAKEPAEASRLLAEAHATAPRFQARLNDQVVTELRDCDDLFGTILEVMAHGNYYWVPLEQVELLAITAPRFPRDLIWLPARLELRDGAAGDVFLPALYPNTANQADDQVRLGRVTDWIQTAEGPVQGVGSRLFLAGEETKSFYEFRELCVELQPECQESLSH